MYTALLRLRKGQRFVSSTTYRINDAADFGSEERPRLRYITETQFSQEWNSTLHTHNCSELFFVTGGQGSFCVRNQEFPTALNDVIVVNAKVPHAEQSQSDAPLSYIVLGVEHLETTGDIGGCTVLHLQERYSRFAACLQLMLQEARGEADGWEAVCQNLLEIMLRWLTRHDDVSFNATSAAEGSKASRECELVRRYIDNHFKENLRLDELAAVAHINKYYLSHAFQKQFGTSPISYLISRRIQESRYLLTDTDHSLSQIAHILGFSSLSYFSQSFRRLEGVSPMEYRRQYRQKQPDHEEKS